MRERRRLMYLSMAIALAISLGCSKKDSQSAKYKGSALNKIDYLCAVVPVEYTEARITHVLSDLNDIISETRELPYQEWIRCKDIDWREVPLFTFKSADLPLYEVVNKLKSVAGLTARVSDGTIILSMLPGSGASFDIGGSSGENKEVKQELVNALAKFVGAHSVLLAGHESFFIKNMGDASDVSYSTDRQLEGKERLEKVRSFIEGADLLYTKRLTEVLQSGTRMSASEYIAAKADGVHIFSIMGSDIIIISDNVAFVAKDESFFREFVDLINSL